MEHTEDKQTPLKDESSAANDQGSVSANDNTRFKEKLLNELKSASPLDSFSILEQMEMYEQMDARQVIDDVYKEFESGENQVETIVIPVFTSVVDGLLQSLGTTKTRTDASGVTSSQRTVAGQVQDMGLSATRIVQECRAFQYGEIDVNAQIYSVVSKNQMMDGYEDFNEQVGTNVSTYYRNRKTAKKHGDGEHYYNYSFTPAQYKKAKEENKKRHGGVFTDEYGNKALYEDKEIAKQAEGDSKNSGELDHVVPLAKVHEQLKDNCMLSDDDVRRIANIDDNLVFTSEEINRSKKDKTNDKYVKDNKENLNRETRRNMLKKAKNAQKKLDSAANKAVLQNMQNPEQLKKLGKQMENVAKDAAKSGVKMGIGNAIIELLKPLYYEMADSFKNGFTEGVGVQKTGDAFKIRMGRIKNHMQGALKGLGLGSLTDLIKGLISSIISAIVDLFFGIVKDLLKLLQKGIPIAISAFKILFDKTKSPAERGDALVKLVGSSLVAILGGLLLDKIFPEKPEGFLRVLKSVCTALLSGCGSLFFMMFMDKIDLFSTKAEKRTQRIQEIFDARCAELHERASSMRVEVINLLKEQRLCFDKLISGAEDAIDRKDINAVVSYSYALAEFFKVELEYSNTKEFVEWWDQQKVIRI